MAVATASTQAQDLNRQRQALRARGCKLIFEDKASGKSLSGLPELARALDKLQPGDCLVLAEWDRATRSMWDGLHIVKHVLDAQATIKVLDFPSLDLATPEGRGFLAMFSAMAERERERIIQRTKEGRRLAMRNGVKMGPHFKLTEHQRGIAAKRMAAGESTRHIAARGSAPALEPVKTSASNPTANTASGNAPPDVRERRLRPEVEKPLLDAGMPPEGSSLYDEPKRVADTPEDG